MRGNAAGGWQLGDSDSREELNVLVDVSNSSKNQAKYMLQLTPDFVVESYARKSLITMCDMLLPSVLLTNVRTIPLFKT